MSREVVRSVRASAADAERIALLQRQYADALHRLKTGPLGDRTEQVRAEQIVSQIERAAYEHMSDEAGGSDDDTLISVVWPFLPGTAPASPAGGGEIEPAATWRAEIGKGTRTAVSFERFTDQLSEWANCTVDRTPKALCPSGKQNRALTEALRRFVVRRLGRPVVEAAVTYQDGSSGPPFPLNAVPMSDLEPSDGRDVLRMTLLSVRHVEMDVDVDGAWLRNREISLPRPGGLTDQLAYEQSLNQFASISTSGPVTVHLYQTGLPQAIMGFYRALVNHNRDPERHGVAVIPYYYEGPNRYVCSELPWVVR